MSSTWRQMWVEPTSALLRSLLSCRGFKYLSSSIEELPNLRNASSSSALGTPTEVDSSGPDDVARNSHVVSKVRVYQSTDSSMSRTVMPTWCSSPTLLTQPPSLSTGEQAASDSAPCPALFSETLH